MNFTKANQTATVTAIEEILKINGLTNFNFKAVPQPKTGNPYIVFSTAKIMSAKRYHYKIEVVATDTFTVFYDKGASKLPLTSTKLDQALIEFCVWVNTPTAEIDAKPVIEPLEVVEQIETVEPKIVIEPVVKVKELKVVAVKDTRKKATTKPVATKVAETLTFGAGATDYIEEKMKAHKLHGINYTMVAKPKTGYPYIAVSRDAKPTLAKALFVFELNTNTNRFQIKHTEGKRTTKISKPKFESAFIDFCKWAAKKVN